MEIDATNATFASVKSEKKCRVLHLGGDDEKVRKRLVSVDAALGAAMLGQTSIGRVPYCERFQELLHSRGG